MLGQQDLHSVAVVEQILDYATHFVAVIEVSCEPVDVDYYVHQRDPGQSVEGPLLLLIFTEG